MLVGGRRNRPLDHNSFSWEDEIQMFAHDIFSFLYNRGGQHQNEINVSTSKITMYCDLVNTIV
jgi:hypothetical protein